jgi:antitoxin VapB
MNYLLYFCVVVGNGIILKTSTMKIETVSVDDISGSQLIKLPDNFKINDTKVYLKKVGDVLYIIPFHNAWQSLALAVNEFTDDFLNDRQQPFVQKRESLD